MASYRNNNPYTCYSTNSRSKGRHRRQLKKQRLRNQRYSTYKPKLNWFQRLLSLFR